MKYHKLQHLARAIEGITAILLKEVLRLKKPEKNQTVMKSALLMSIGTLFSRILGFVRDAAVLALFDRKVTDVFTAAFLLPNFFRRLLGEGALSVSFIPVFVDQIYGEKGSEAEKIARAKKLSHAVFTLLMIANLTITMFLFIFMEKIVGYWLGQEEFLKVPGKLELAVDMSRITIFYLALVTAYAYFMAISQALKKFFIPALAPAFFNLFFILTIFLPGSLFDFSEMQLAWAVLVGGVIQLLIVSVQLARMGYLPRLTVQLRLPGVGLILRNMAPGIVALGASQLMNILNIWFSSGFAEGSMSYVYTTNRLLELPQSLIAISIGTALLPTLSQLNSQGKTKEMIQTTNEHIRMLLFLALPSALGLFLLSNPIVSVLFERQKWGAHESEIVAGLVQIISLMLIFSGVHRLLIPGFYAIKNTLLPAVLTTIIVTCHFFLAPILMDTLGLKGLIWSVTASGFLGLCLAICLYNYMIGRLGVISLVGYCLRYVPGLVVMGVVVHFGFSNLLNFLDPFLGLKISKMISLFSIISVSVLVYFVVGHFLQLKEAHAVTRRFRRFLPKASS